MPGRDDGCPAPWGGGLPAWSLSLHTGACHAAWGSCDPGKRQVMMIAYNEAAPIMSTGLLSDHRLDTSENKLF